MKQSIDIRLGLGKAETLNIKGKKIRILGGHAPTLKRLTVLRQYVDAGECFIERDGHQYLVNFIGGPFGRGIFVGNLCIYRRGHCGSIRFRKSDGYRFDHSVRSLLDFSPPCPM